MNRFEAERRFAQRMKDNYPPGTRIMLLSMGDDPRPVEGNTRGTGMAGDDIGTLHCDFDNGRSLGIVPGEDSFRKLTDEELAEEQQENMDEDNAPVMGMQEVKCLEIEIPDTLSELLLTQAAEQEIPVEEIVKLSIKKYIERNDENAV